MNFADFVALHALRTPDASAIVERGREISYARFDAAVWRAAAWLRAQGIRPGDVIGISMPDSALHLAVLLGLMRMGTVYTLLPAADPVALRQALARRARAMAVIAPSTELALEGRPAILPDPAWLEASGAAADPSLRVEGDDRTCLIGRSSGTTAGIPKGFAYSHSDVWAVEQRMQRYSPTPPDDRYLGVISLSLTYGQTSALRALCFGGCLVLPDNPLQPQEIPELVDRFAINRLELTPYHLDAMLPSLPEDRPRCPGVRSLSATGMMMPHALRLAVRRRLAPHLLVKYGSNEGGWKTVADPELQDRFPDTAGMAFPGVELEIVDEQDRPVPPGQTGAVRIRGEGTVRAYIDNPEATARACRHGWYYPGDVGVLTPEGALFLLGRTDDVINFQGVKIVPADIERVLLQHPAVAEAAVFSLPSQRDQDRPAAAVVVRQQITAQALSEYCRERLGAQAPRFIGLVGNLPRNAMGKVLRRELAEAFARNLAAKGR